jgi:predicted regulator of Ras-like GTPase activity (Roadblock/LC7/MglB family)
VRRQGLKEDIEELLMNLKEKTRGEILGVAVVRPDGAVMASALPREIGGEKRFAAMALVVLGTANRVCDELGAGNMDQVIIDGSKMKAILMSAGEKALLAVLASKDANVKSALSEMKRASTEVKKVMAKY